MAIRWGYHSRGKFLGWLDVHGGGVCFSARIENPVHRPRLGIDLHDHEELERWLEG